VSGDQIYLDNSGIRDVSFILRNLFKGGSLAASEILKEAGNLLPQYRSHLHAGSRAISTKGATFSEAINGLFPESTMVVIRAGEESGSLGKVFDRIWKTAKDQEEINKLLSKLIMPVSMIGVGLVISFAFMTFLVPHIYTSFSNAASAGYEPNLMIKAGLATNAFIMSNLELSIGSIVAFLVMLVALSKNPVVVESVSQAIVRLIIHLGPLGRAYSNLKFGILAQYIQIVSAAGLDADKRIDLVINVLPVPLQPALKAFRGDMFAKGIGASASADGRAKNDPRLSEIFWPPYIRLAFSQANEGDWEGPMEEFGGIMIEDGKESFAKQIEVLKFAAIVLVGIFVMIPVALLYGAIGEVLAQRMNAL